MEVLLLDTTEKEGEDNALYHYAQSSTTRESTRWLELRGVLAAAAGTAASLCGEPLRCIRFSRGDQNDVCAGVAGVVDMGDVLYVLVFPDEDVPTSVVQYYARSSCDLLLSFFGYPDRKLMGWRQQREGISVQALAVQLDVVCRGMLAVIQRNRSFQSHLHFAFGGHVPAVNYPLDTMAELAMLEIPLEDPTDSPREYSVIGRCIFFRKQLVLSTMRSDVLQLLFQWLLDGEDFSPDCSVVKQSTHESVKASMNSATYALHDFCFARYGVYPRRHALVVTTTGELQTAFLVEQTLDILSNSASCTGAWADRLQGDTDWERMRVLADFCDVHLAPYLETVQRVREQQAQALQALLRLDLRECKASPTRFLWYSVVLDRLRGVLLADELPQAWSVDKAEGERTNQGGKPLQSEDQVHLDAILSYFVHRVADLQQTLRRARQFTSQSSPELPTGISPLKLAVDDSDALFLREQLNEDIGTDISTDSARIFPSQCQNYAEKEKRAVQQVAERVVVDGQTLWIVASSFETLEAFAVLDATLPLEQLLTHELSRLCVFGGAETTETAAAPLVAESEST